MVMVAVIGWFMGVVVVVVKVNKMNAAILQVAAYKSGSWSQQSWSGPWSRSWSWSWSGSWSRSSSWSWAWSRSTK